MAATITTDASGNPTAVITEDGTGYKTGDTITFAVPDGSGSDSVTLTLVNAATSAVISTVSADGTTAGNITLGAVDPTSGAISGGTNIMLGANATLDSVGASKSGTIVVAASDVGQRLISAPVDYTNKNADITIDGTLIEGGSVTISATAEDTNLTTDAPSDITNFTGTLATLLNQIPGVVLGDFLGIDASVVLRGANAVINIDNATITSSGSVSIKATTSVTTQVSAITSGLGLLATATGVSFAAGYGQATSDVEVNILGSTTITAANSVTVAASGTTSDSVQAYADSNVYTTQNPSKFSSSNINSNAVSIALAGAYNNLTALATVGAGAAITSVAGDINITATGKQTTKPDARTYSPVDGAGGARSASIGKRPTFSPPPTAS